jgi:RNA polymerase sigma-70 factor, ECF subfamily
MQSFSDEQLMRIYQDEKDSQQQVAFDCLYHRYAKAILQFFYFSLNNDYAKAQDFLHDLFVKIIEKPGSFDSKQNFKAWIYRIASNMCKNEYRRSAINQKYYSHLENTAVNIVLESETEKKLHACICQLSQEYRSLITLRFKMNLTIKEMAGIYECPEGTIKSRLFYATKELTKLYKR